VKSIDDGVYMICGPTHGGRREVTRRDFREQRAGPRVVLRTGDRIDVVCTVGKPANDRDVFKSAGIILDEKRIFALKSNHAHRASGGPIAAAIFDLATPGLSTVDYASLPFRHLRRPLWPIDTDFAWDG